MRGPSTAKSAGKKTSVPSSDITTTKLPAMATLRSSISGKTVIASRLTATAPPEYPMVRPAVCSVC
ncbi:MAG: hypothetical protein RLZZ450_4802 [Pseudomonadota bacterium]